MIAVNYIENSIPFLKKKDLAWFALDLMTEHKMPALPLVHQNKYLGVVTEDQIHDLENFEDAAISLIIPKFQDIKVKDSDHIFEIIKVMSMNDLSFITVVDRKNNYLGIITTERIIREWGRQTSIMEPGGVIILEMKASDYSLTELSRIVESNDANVLHAFVSSRPSAGIIEVTLKVNRTDLKEVIGTLERFEYQIKASFHESDMEENLKERYDSFMHYLNI